MKIHRHILVCFLFLFSYSLAHGQITLETVTPPSTHSHEEGDSTYHCGMCDRYLFDDDEAIDLGNGDLHVHGIGTDSLHSLFQCAACNGHLGSYDHQHHKYDLANDQLTKDDSGVFYCASCNLPLFAKQSLLSADDSNSSFKEPIKYDRINLSDSDAFYKVSGSNLTCKACKGKIGSIAPNQKGGFGMRVNLSKVKKGKKTF